MRLIDKEAIKGDTDPKALAAYGMLVRTKEVDGQLRERTWLRFVDGRPVSSITTQFLEYSCQKLAAMGKKALLMIWDNASWHTGKEVRSWIAEHNRGVKKSGSAKLRGADSALFASQEEPLAQRNRAQMDPRQEEGRRAREVARR